MILFKKSLLGANCNRLYDFDIALRKDMSHLHAMVELKKTAQAKVLISQIQIQKWTHQIAK